MITVIINIIFSIMEKAIVNIRMELIYFKENGDLNNFDNFQIYEWIGDTILGYHVSKILSKISSQSFPSPGASRHKPPWN